MTHPWPTPFLSATGTTLVNAHLSHLEGGILFASGMTVPSIMGNFYPSFVGRDINKEARILTVADSYLMIPGATCHGMKQMLTRNGRDRSWTLGDVIKLLN